MKSVLIIWVLIAIGIGISACDAETLSNIATIEPFSTTPTKTLYQTTLPSSDWYQLYFTSPQYPDEPNTRVREILNALIRVIDSAQESLDIAIYELNLDEIGDALLRAKARGVQVRMVTDSDSLSEYETLITLKKEGIPIVPDKRNPLMHNKFMVVDNKAVWTGSYNWTSSCTFRNNNNAIYIRSVELAKSYRAEFEEMFTNKQFGPFSPERTPYPEVIIEGTRIQICFAPEDKCGNKIVSALQKAKISIHFMAFSFTHDYIGKTLEKQIKSGLEVSGVFEQRGSETDESEYAILKMIKADVLRDGNPYIMHHKVFIIDEKIVILGSFNFSKNADTSNDENLLIIHNVEIAKRFLTEYELVYQQAAQTKNRY